MSDRDGTRWKAALLIAALVAAVLAPAPAAGAAPTGEEPSFVATLHADGSAAVALTYTFDLTTESERAAFEELRTNETAQAETVTRFRNRMETVAADAANATGRDMSVEEASIDLSTTGGGDTGVVVLSVTWNGLAAVEGDRLVVTEPFASGFEPDRPFTVRWPDGYELAYASPAPADATATSATWNAGTDLDGFSLTVAESSTPPSTASPTEGSGPGFGVTAAFVAFAGATLLARRL